MAKRFRRPHQGKLLRYLCKCFNCFVLLNIQVLEFLQIFGLFFPPLNGNCFVTKSCSSSVNVIWLFVQGHPICEYCLDVMIIALQSNPILNSTTSMFSTLKLFHFQMVFWILCKIFWIFNQSNSTYRLLVYFAKKAKKILF